MKAADDAQFGRVRQEQWLCSGESAMLPALGEAAVWALVSPINKK
jgi:hypothetical protein